MDANLPSWAYTLPDIGFTVPDWIRIDMGKYKQADSGRQGRDRGSEPARVRVPGPIPVIIYKDGEFQRFDSINMAEKKKAMSAKGTTRGYVSSGNILRRKSGQIIWIEGREAPAEIKEAYEAWRKK